MRKHYLLSLLTSFLFLFALCATAQTAYVGIRSTGSVDWKDGNGYNFCMVGFDISAPETITEVPFKGESDSEFEVAGCLAGSAYYALMCDDNTDAYSLHSLNCATGKDLKLADMSSVLDMTYDTKTAKLYAINTYYDDESNGTALYEVNVKSGELTEVYRFADKKFHGVAAKDGMLYLAASEKIEGDWWNYNFRLTTYNPATQEAVDGEVLGTTKSLGSTNCIAFEGENLYIIQGRKLYLADLKAKAVTMVTDKLAKEFTGLCFEKSTTDGGEEGEVTPEPQPTAKKLVSIVETYGDHMGAYKSLTKKQVTYYDGNGNPVRQGDYEIGQVEDQLSLARYYTNNYDENGHLTSSYTQQYGIYDGDDWGFKAAADTVKYAYNEAGELTQKTDSYHQEITTYEYANGLLATETVYIIGGNEKPIQKLTYSNYTDNGQAQDIVSEGLYDYLKYHETIAYNAAGQKTSRTRNAYANNVNEDEHAIEQETWEYAPDGMLTLSLLKKAGYDSFGNQNGELLPYSKVEYTLDNGIANRVVAKTYTAYYDAKSEDYLYSENPTYTITETKEYDPALATTLAVTGVEGKLNTQKLSFTLPEAALIGNYVFDIYRHGVNVGRVKLTDEGAYDPENNTLNYVDADVQNGTWDYFVQTVAVDEMEEAEDPLNISNVVSYKAYTELPAPTNVRATAKEEKGGSTYVTLAWDAPNNAADYGFKRYNVLYKNARTADNAEKDGQATTWTTEYQEWNNELYIQAVYTYGKANSELYTIAIEDVPTAIASTLAEGAAVSYANQVVSLSTQGDVCVYAANGAQVKQASRTTGVSLQELPAGTYIVAATINGKLHMVKVAK